jgi:AcrR family transcriptional regulator
MAPTDEIMRATCAALRAHGYADVTMQDIADESTKSKAALHYHYDSKRDLLIAFLDHLSERYLTRLRAAEADATGPIARLSAVFDAALAPPEDDLKGLQTALLELKAQSPYEAAFRERSRRTDAALRELLEEILAAGTETGAFRAGLDVESTARFAATALSGAYLRQVSLGQTPDRTRELLATHVERRVHADRAGDADRAGTPGE